MTRITQRIGAARAVSGLLAACALTIFGGCSGHTTGASDITRQPNGTYSAKLNVVGSCEKGSPNTPCTGYMRWRVVGTKAWTNGPTISVGRKVTDLERSQTATGLSPKATYEFQACGKEFSDPRVTCVGPDGKPNTSQQFVTIRSPGQAGHQAATPTGTQSTTSGPASTASPGSGGVGGGGGTSPLVPIAIAVGAGALVLGGTWWASRRFHW